MLLTLLNYTTVDPGNPDPDPDPTMDPLNRLSIKKHLNIDPRDTFILPLIAQLEDGGDVQTEAAAAIAACDTALAAIRAAQTEADDIVEGGGAKFDANRKISIKKRQYRELVNDLCRIIGFPQASDTACVTGFMSL